MISDASKKSLIYNEMGGDNRSNWFDLKQKKFLNTIDTLYYSVLLKEDFTNNGKTCKNVKRLRNFFKSCESSMSLIDDFVVDIPGLPKYFNLSKFSYGSGTYEYRLCRADYYDIFISLRTANRDTSQILVQLRSKALWMDSVNKTIFTSLDDVIAFCKYFGLTIVNVQENRLDYCWHTNYVQSPQTFFNPENFARMRLSRLSDSNMHVNYYGNEDYEVDYLTLGKKSSKNVFFRIYLKSKEVVEMGYKAFFLKMWLLNGLINRYDFYVYEYAYETRRWNDIHKGRLKFYLEHGSDAALRKQCDDILQGKIKFNYDELKYFADMITPSVTLVINVEFQTMRKFTSSIVFPNSYTSLLFDSDYKNSRLMDVIGNYGMICEYLTGNVLRLVKTSGDTNKSRRDDCAFWECLRRSKSIDGHVTLSDSKLIRKYDHQKNAHLQQMRIFSGIAGKSLHEKGDDNSSAEDDLLDFISSLNDNDIEDYNKVKRKRARREDFSTPAGQCKNNYFSVANDDGEIKTLKEIWNER